MRQNKTRNRSQLVGLSIALISLPAAVLAGGDDANGENGDNGVSPCERTADAMASSCRFGVGEELFLTLANCKNVSDGEERRSCVEEARAARKEDMELCGDVEDARIDACELLGEKRYEDPLLSPAHNFIDPDDIPATYAPNPYVSLIADHTYVLRAGEDGDELGVVHVTGESREILGVECRVVEDIGVEVEESDGGVEYEAVEVTDDLFAQDDAGNVYYCGEVSRSFDDGVLRSLGGSFEAGRDFAKAGTLILSFPVAGDAHRQEFALGEAEDLVQYVDLEATPTEEEGGDNASFPCGDPGACLKTLESAPIEPDSAEFKYYLPDTGFVLAVVMEDGEFTGEREEVVCIGESPDVLQEPSCGIADLPALLEELCQHSDTFCTAGSESDEE